MKLLREFDYLFLGGGLSSGLTALMLAEKQPSSKIGIIEAGPKLGGNHTWSFHATDVTTSQLTSLRPLISHSWPTQSVSFPSFNRDLSTGYFSITSEQFDEVLSQHPQIEVQTEQTVSNVENGVVQIEGDDKYRSQIIFDGRGATSNPHLDVRFQKFLGQEINLSKPHGLSAPVIMDACIEQNDGYRFFYLLPLSETRLLVEDTYYADGYQTDPQQIREEISTYIDNKGWKIDHVVREEDGVLPITLDGDVKAFWASFDGQSVPIGLRAGLFHPVTGYSVSEAIRLADHISNFKYPDTTSYLAHVRGYAINRWREHRFYRLLNRMLFKAAAPEDRFKVLARFYRLPQPLIERFYAGDNSWSDKARILMGKPPVPITAALKALPSKRKGQPIKEGILG